MGSAALSSASSRVWRSVPASAASLSVAGSAIEQLPSGKLAQQLRRVAQCLSSSEGAPSVARQRRRSFPVTRCLGGRRRSDDRVTSEDAALKGIGIRRDLVDEFGALVESVARAVNGPRQRASPTGSRDGPAGWLHWRERSERIVRATSGGSCRANPSGVRR